MKSKISPILFRCLYAVLIALSLLLIVGGIFSFDFKMPSSISIRAILLGIMNFIVSFGFLWLIFPYLSSRIFERVYALAEDEIVEGVRIAIISPFSLDTASEIRSRLERGDAIYVESKDNGVFCSIRKGGSNKQGILVQMVSGQEDSFDCEDLVTEVIEMGVTDGFTLYDFQAWDEMQNRGYSLQDVG